MLQLPHFLLVLLPVAPSLALVIPPPIARPVVIGTSDYSNLLYGKIQRAASLYGTNLKEPVTVLQPGYDDVSCLNKCLWNQFGMACPDGTLDEEDLLRPLSSWIPLANLEGSLLFMDAVSERKKSLSVFDFFQKNQQDEPNNDGPISSKILACAQERKCVLSSEENLHECKKSLGACTVPSTILYLDSTTTMEFSKDWMSSRTQDMEGDLSSSTVLQLYDPEGETISGTTSLPAHDVAEIMLQVAVRTSRSPLDIPRVAQVTAGGGAGDLKERLNADYFTMVGGKKARERAGTVNSVPSWASALSPLGKVNVDLCKRTDR